MNSLQQKEPALNKFRLLLLPLFARLHNPNLRQVPELFGIVQSVADDEFVGDFDAAVVDGDVGKAAGGLAEDGADADTSGLTESKELLEMLQGQAGVDHVLDEEDMFAADVGVDVFLTVMTPLEVELAS